MKEVNDDPLANIQDLFKQAADTRKDAGKEKQHAQVLQAQGHTVGAAYHYDRYKDKKAEAERLESQANQQMADYQAAVQKATADAQKDKKKVIYYGPDGKPK
ncbi:MAG: hypothetical protein M0D55_09365 [Elusimicrobiota bacterium]|nr:MAG: hypothetical protein M0D55_09365 [Elusimicrobiota bacterium]